MPPKTLTMTLRAEVCALILFFCVATTEDSMPWIVFSPVGRIDQPRFHAGNYS